MSQGIEIQTVVRVYCDGPDHNHTKLIFDGQPSVDYIAQMVTLQGFATLDDGRVYCHNHTNGSGAK